MKKVNFVCNTNGHGLWSGVSKPVTINGVKIRYLNEEKTFGELIATFPKSSWSIQDDGLIYTDPKWMDEFRRMMKVAFRLSDAAVFDIDYSEQGMQGDDYVSMDVGKPFLKEWLKE